MVPAGLGVGTTRHLVPFHCSTRVRGMPPVALPEFWNPTAMHDLAPTQETPLSSATPPRVGVAKPVHPDPFHSIATVEPETKFPTARQSLESKHATALSWVEAGPVAVTDHAVPFQSSANALKSEFGEENE